MSRDLTPREMYELEQYNIHKGHGSLWDFMKNTTVSYNGQTWPLASEESLARRQQFPLLGRLFNDYDKLYSFLSQVNGGLDLLANHEETLKNYLETGKGDANAPVIRWFEGELDRNFYYCEHNDARFLATVQDEVGKLFRFDPSLENCFWFPLSNDKCISVWLAPDKEYGDQLLMKLEQRAPDGSMDPHCKVLIDESYASGDLSYDAIRRVLKEIYEDAGLDFRAEESRGELTNKVMSVFGLKKRALDEQIQSTEEHSGTSKTDTNVRSQSPTHSGR